LAKGGICQILLTWRLWDKLHDVRLMVVYTRKMKMFNLIIKEMIHRKMSFLLSLLAIITAVALFISFFTAGQASKRETVKLMLNMGFNLRIIPNQTDMDKFWLTGVSDHTMPDNYIQVLADSKNISYNHITAILHQKVIIRDKDVILTGLSSEVIRSDKQNPMAFVINPGSVYVGYEIAKNMDIKKGDAIDIFGKNFRVEKTLAESGSDDDIRIYGNLNEIQDITNMKGKINEIKALECLCLIGDGDPVTALRAQVEKLIPEAKVILIRSLAETRQKQRTMADKYFSFILPIVLIVCAAWICALAMINVRDRKQEIGIMRAIGYGSSRIAFLFLGKAILIGLIGSAVGFAVGTGLAMQFGPDIFKVTAKAIKPSYVMLLWSALAAPIFAAISSFIPTMVAVTQDPADTLKEE
jgi:putative ABC transport system permease protein